MRRSLFFLVCGVLGLGLTVACGGGDQGIPVFFQSDRDGQWEIYSVSHTGANLTRLTNDPAADTSPELSYDGTKVAFIRAQGATSDIWAMNTDGTNQRNVTNGKAGGTISVAGWFPAAGQLIFAMSKPDVANGHSQLYSIKEDGEGLTRITKDDALNYLAPRVHPGGGQIITAAGPDENALDIHIVGTNGDFIRIVPKETFRSLERGFDQPGVIETGGDFDSTGRAIIFQTNLQERWAIFRVEGDGRKPTNLTPEDAKWNETEPSWSGALERLWYAYVSDKDGNQEVYIKKMGTEETVRLTNNPAKDVHPTWVKTPPTK